MMKALCISLILLLFAASIAPAQEPETPENLFPNISTATLKIRLDTTKNFVLIDVRSEEEYIEGHIPRAINVPPEKMHQIVDYLPKDKEIPIVFYCRGYVWALEHEAAVVARRAGYENLIDYHEGYPGWVAAGLPIETGKK